MIKEQINEERRAINEKKRQALDFLKEQMEADLKVSLAMLISLNAD